jgi:hypothetical protein
VDRATEKWLDTATPQERAAFWRREGKQMSREDFIKQWCRQYGESLLPMRVCIPADTPTGWRMIVKDGVEHQVFERANAALKHEVASAWKLTFLQFVNEWVNQACGGRRLEFDLGELMPMRCECNDCDCPGWRMVARYQACPPGSGMPALLANNHPLLKPPHVERHPDGSVSLHAADGRTMIELTSDDKIACQGITCGNDFAQMLSRVLKAWLA